MSPFPCGVGSLLIRLHPTYPRSLPVTCQSVSVVGTNRPVVSPLPNKSFSGVYESLGNRYPTLPKGLVPNFLYQSEGINFTGGRENTLVSFRWSTVDHSKKKDRVGPKWSYSVSSDGVSRVVLDPRREVWVVQDLVPGTDSTHARLTLVVRRGGSWQPAKEKTEHPDTSVGGLGCSWVPEFLRHQRTRVMMSFLRPTAVERKEGGRKRKRENRCEMEVSGRHPEVCQVSKRVGQECGSTW